MKDLREKIEKNLKSNIPIIENKEKIVECCINEIMNLIDEWYFNLPKKPSSGPMLNVEGIQNQNKQLMEHILKLENEREVHKSHLICIETLAENGLMNLNNK